MTDEKLRDLLFGNKASEVKLSSVRCCRELKLFPLTLTESSAKRWRESSFIGNLLYHNPMRHGLIAEIGEVIGRQPTVYDFTESNILKIVEYLETTKAPNSAKQYASIIKSTLSRLLESEDYNVVIPCKRYAKLLTLKGCPTTKTYLTPEDLMKFFSYKPQTEMERVCQAIFAVTALTGTRYSDVFTLKKSNIQDGVLVYVPQKTKAHGTVVPIKVSDTVSNYIGIIEGFNKQFYLSQYHDTLRAIGKKCGLDEEVTYFWGGKYVTKPKYEALRSHLGRVSFVTNLLKMGMQIHEVSKLAGHTDVAMTARYNASTDVKLTKEAEEFLNMKF